LAIVIIALMIWFELLTCKYLSIIW